MKLATFLSPGGDLAAGVDLAIQEDPRNWFARAPEPAPVEEQETRAPLPSTLESFRDWLAGPRDQATRLREARFPYLAVNLKGELPGILPSRILKAGSLNVGVIGIALPVLGVHGRAGGDPLLRKVRLREVEAIGTRAVRRRRGCQAPTVAASSARSPSGSPGRSSRRGRPTWSAWRGRR